MGINELAIFTYDDLTDSPSELTKRIDGILAGMEMGDNVIFQSPVWISSKFEKRFIDKVKLYQGKVIIFINDVPPMMFVSNEVLMPNFIEVYNKADLLIVSSENMKEYLVDKGVTVKKIIIQNLWDIPVEFEKSSETKYLSKISFAGSDKKFGISEKLKSSDIKVEIYDNRPDSKEIPDNIHYSGYVDEISLLSRLHEGGFGLIWSEDEHIKNYMHYCNSYKMSTYLRAGIPIVAHKSISCANLIEKNNWGILVDTLEEAVEVINNMSEEEYQKYIDSVSKVSFLLGNNWFTKKLLVDSIYKL
ncbi:nucleotide sugar synthetase [Ligilactobacillus salivarius]|nr:nucleotide sugar synthetase [Ligilactobacillus salivarius]MBE7392046.1 nucleotide sugar synthetase [Ligilactobacillus salivarius]MCF2623724.1 nucleotide sugar synthetase [Ligilactobacillus salivarius]NME24742.1 nucleotide sugar synthetase [Ligilactobacillus salivarius]NXZ97131.1 nucleotide sugar synthetase [Ligilactobacillus salivarius]